MKICYVEPRKKDKSVFLKKRKYINDDTVTVLISYDRKENKHLQVATRGKILTTDINKVLKDKLDPETVLCTDGHVIVLKLFYKKTN